MFVGISEATTRLSQLITEVERTGAEVVIRRHNVPADETFHHDGVQVIDPS
jgi:antitoxin (DNA-binding transcriptional repressor) of toxin-antitoxin stability system